MNSIIGIKKITERQNNLHLSEFNLRNKLILYQGCCKQSWNNLKYAKSIPDRQALFFDKQFAFFTSVMKFLA